MGKVPISATSSAEVTSPSVSGDDTSAADNGAAPSTSLSPTTVDPTASAILSDSDLANSASHVSPTAAVEQSTGDDNQSAEVDLDDFVKGLGLDPDEASAEQNPSSPGETTISTESSSQSAQISEEELEERRRQKLLETAQKRQEIESRHAKWEEKVADAIVAQLEVVQKALTDLRNSASAELKNSVQMRKELDTLHGEADKAIRGTEAYFTKLKNENRSEGEKARLWDRVLNKVWEKFQDRVKGVEATINNWYSDLAAKEVEEVGFSISLFVREIDSMLDVSPPSPPFWCITDRDSCDNCEEYRRGWPSRHWIGLRMA